MHSPRRGPLDRLYRDIHAGSHPGDRFHRAYWLTREGGSADLGDDDEAWESGPDLGVGQTIASLLGILLQGVIGYFPLGFTLFVAPLPVIVAVYGQWLTLLVLVVRMRATHPWLVLLIPILDVVAWAVLMWFGWTRLGWPPISMPGLT